MERGKRQLWGAPSKYFCLPSFVVVYIFTLNFWSVFIIGAIFIFGVICIFGVVYIFKGHLLLKMNMGNHRYEQFNEHFDDILNKHLMEIWMITF